MARRAATSDRNAPGDVGPFRHLGSKGLRITRRVDPRRDFIREDGNGFVELLMRLSLMVYRLCTCTTPVMNGCTVQM